MKRLPLAIVAVVAALVATGLLGAGLAAGSSAAKGTTVKVTKSHLGKIVVDGRGRTLYLFEKDKRGSGRSTCSGACAGYWPPLLTSAKPIAGTGVKKSLLGTIKRSNGKKQVTYNGHPLYRFVQDTKAGQTKGQATDFFGGEWYVVSPAGKKIGD
jgi:predicted lipoprotein with Yx(FWY)xxD motif